MECRKLAVSLCVVVSAAACGREDAAQIAMQVGPSSTSDALDFSPVQVVESSHPYGNDLDRTWVVTKPGATNLKVVLERIETESGYDWLYVTDASGSQSQRFTGDRQNVEVTLLGDT